MAVPTDAVDDMNALTALEDPIWPLIFLSKLACFDFIRLPDFFEANALALTFTLRESCFVALDTHAGLLNSR